MKLFFLFLFAGMMSSCAITKVEGNGEGQKIVKPPMNLTAKLGKSKENSDLLTIENTTVKGNNLIIDISYTGGCTEHGFELEGNEMISKSLPPIRAIRLVHKSNGDTCKAIVNQTLTFDISEFAYKQEAGSEIMLKIEGVEEQVKYTFK